MQNKRKNSIYRTKLQNERKLREISRNKFIKISITNMLISHDIDYGFR